MSTAILWPFYCSRLFNLPLWVLLIPWWFRFVWPFFTYIGSFTITWNTFTSVRPPTGGLGVVCTGSATD